MSIGYCTIIYSTLGSQVEVEVEVMGVDFVSLISWVSNIDIHLHVDG